MRGSWTLEPYLFGVEGDFGGLRLWNFTVLRGRGGGGGGPCALELYYVFQG